MVNIPDKLLCRCSLTFFYQKHTNAHNHWHIISTLRSHNLNFFQSCLRVLILVLISLFAFMNDAWMSCVCIWTTLKPRSYNLKSQNVQLVKKNTSLAFLSSLTFAIPFFTMHLSLFTFCLTSLLVSILFLLSLLVHSCLGSPGIPVPLCIFQKMPLQCCHIKTMSSSSSASPRGACIFWKLCFHPKATFQSQN